MADEICHCHECILSRNRAGWFMAARKRLLPYADKLQETEILLRWPRRDPKTKKWRWGRVIFVEKSFISVYLISIPHIMWDLVEIRPH